VDRGLGDSSETSLGHGARRSGAPDYLAPVAELVYDLCLVHRYDQRGTGGSPWEGDHTIARHVQDLASLLDACGHDRVVLMGHSFTDHADRTRAWDWALAAARTLRPINYAMNTPLNAAKKTDPLESRVNELRELLPPGAVIIGGAGDTRPTDALRRLGARLNCEVIIIPNAGHEAWLEAPDQFGAALRAAVKRQAQAAGCLVSDTQTDGR
jgi:pimeloyl-ACP methyl ester carboxylesterase